MTTLIQTEETLRIRVASIREDFLSRARDLGLDDQGQAVRRVTAEGGEPCRDVLRRARPGEALILASYSPFAKQGPYREYGPVFILADKSNEEVTRDALPPSGGPDHYLREQFVVRAYSEDEEIRDARLIAASEFADTVRELLELSHNAFLHLRFPTYGCFACRIDRRRDAR